MKSLNTMKTGLILGFFVAIMAAVLLLPSASAFASIDYVEVNSFIISQPGTLYSAANAGETLDMRVVLHTLVNPANTNQFPDGSTVKEDVTVMARVLGESISDTSEERDFLPGRTYSVPLSVTLPDDLDLLDEVHVVQVTVETQSEGTAPLTFSIGVQRSNDKIQILSVESDSTVQAGEALSLEVVVENIGRDQSEDTFVEAKIPELGISRRIFLEDLSSSDTSNNEDEDDSAFGIVRLNIPSDAPAGLYNVVITAFNDETQTSVTRRIEIVGGGAGNVFASSASRTFAVGTSGEYSLTLVNAGNRIMVYTLVSEADEALDVDLDETVVAVPAGSSKTVQFTVTADREGDYDFKVNVHGANGAVIAEQSYTANVEGKAKAVGGNAAVVLTIVLAIIFVVLLVVLIVLLTRKPEKAEEFGESYY